MKEDKDISFYVSVDNQLITIETPTTPIVKNDEKFPLTSEYVNWGIDNTWPTAMRQKLECSTLAMQNIYKLSSALYGQGLFYYKETIENGKRVSYEVMDKEIEYFNNNNDIQQYFIDAILDFFTYFNTFSRLVLNQGSSLNKERKVVAVQRMEPEWCRFKQMDSYGIKELVYSPEFVKNGSIREPKNAKVIKTIRSGSLEDFIKNLKDDYFCLPVHSHSPGRTYYALPPWAALLENGSWLDTVIEIPKVIRSIHKSLVTLKYHIEVPINYFKMRFPEWDKSYNAKKRKESIDAVLKEFQQKLQGGEEIHKAILTIFDTHEATGEALPSVKITPLQDYLKKDSYLPNAQAANAEICYAQGINPTLAGLDIHGGKIGAGSGSSERVSQNNLNLQMKFFEDIVLQPIRLIAKINKWDPEIKFGFRRLEITTLNQSKSGINGEVLN